MKFISSDTNFCRSTMSRRKARFDVLVNCMRSSLIGPHRRAGTPVSGRDVGCGPFLNSQKGKSSNFPPDFQKCIHAVFQERIFLYCKNDPPPIRHLDMKIARADLYAGATLERYVAGWKKIFLFAKLSVRNLWQKQQLVHAEMNVRSQMLRAALVTRARKPPRSLLESVRKTTASWLRGDSIVGGNEWPHQLPIRRENVRFGSNSSYTSTASNPHEPSDEIGFSSENVSNSKRTRVPSSIPSEFCANLCARTVSTQIPSYLRMIAGYKPNTMHIT